MSREVDLNHQHIRPDRNPRFSVPRPRIYEKIHAGVIALVPAGELVDNNLAPDAGDGLREVQLEPGKNGGIPLMEITIIGDNENSRLMPRPTGFLPVLGVKLQEGASQWIPASAVHTLPQKGSTGLIVRAPVQDK